MSAGPSRHTPTATARFAEGPYAGHTLSWLWAEHRELFDNCEETFRCSLRSLGRQGRPFDPDSPNDEYAAEHENGSLGKTECSGPLDCEPGAIMIVGQRAKDRTEAAQMIEEGRCTRCSMCCRFTRVTFSRLTPNGARHQDWCAHFGDAAVERRDVSLVRLRPPRTDGKLRPLHIEQSLDCINFYAQAPTDGTVTAPEVDGVTELESYPCYTVDRVRVDGSKTLEQRWPFMCRQSSTAKAPSAATPSTREATCWHPVPSAPFTPKARWN